MRGSAKYQANAVFQTINEINSSRNDAKGSVSYDDSHQLAQQTGIFSYRTLDEYREIARDLLEYAKENEGIKDIEKINEDTVKNYLEAKLQESIQYSTLQLQVSAISKLDVALQAYNGQEYNLSQAAHSVLEQARTDGMGPKEQHRAFINPEKVVNAISDEKYRVIANFQLASGLRLHELNHIKSNQLLEKDGHYYVRVEQGKGGKDRVVEVQDATAFREFKDLVQKNARGPDEKYAGKFTFSKTSYDHVIAKAAKMVGEVNSSSHSFRWNYAQNRVNELQVKEGMSFVGAKEQVSHELGHNRIEITNHYLK